ncbi:hypothetical protein SAMN05421803_101834 [Nocardiopsis flavescens]|uniref:Uncharacterized protein n=1 Tax=Nocardiopsis flavescens TaxID=758803 RepID=A0A1M6CVK9_9ACTN|nr:DUF5959 family protein [Nocardiopsis flavescens]SHI65026.1 hypothetical protein SAMN05421803_101834 [Nocardiopsis flavescens]
MEPAAPGSPRVLELFRFHDPRHAVAALVTVPDTPGAPAVAAELVVESAFVSGRVGLSLTGADLADWELRLADLEALRAVQWPPAEQGAWLSVVPDAPFLITVYDAGRVPVEVRVPVDPAGRQWQEENRAALDRVRRAWEEAGG